METQDWEQAKYLASAFKYVGGAAAVDFVNTADWTERGLEGERLTSAGRLLDWAVGARLLQPETETSLRAIVGAKPAAARRVLRDALELRAVVQRILLAIAGKTNYDADVSELNQRWIRAAASEIALVSSGMNFELAWPRAGESLDSMLWVTAWSAAKLLASSDASRIRRCDGPDCGWFYVDRSRNGLRRWCEMETCGTRMKSQRRAQRQSYNASKPQSNV